MEVPFKFQRIWHTKNAASQNKTNILAGLSWIDLQKLFVVFLRDVIVVLLKRTWNSSHLHTGGAKMRSLCHTTQWRNYTYLSFSAIFDDIFLFLLMNMGHVLTQCHWYLFDDSLFGSTSFLFLSLYLWQEKLPVRSCTKFCLNFKWMHIVIRGACISISKVIVSVM